MNTVLTTFQIILGIAIIVFVLVQQQDSGFYSSSSNIDRSRRGSEKLLYNATIISIILFTLISIANVIV